jgi:ABC-type uncharacterized transport system substrate-binding protein
MSATFQPQPKPIHLCPRRRFLGCLAGLAFLFFGVAQYAFAAATADGAKEFRILHIMSYHSPWRWTDRQLEGFQAELKGVRATYEVFQMDTKRNSSKEQKDKKGLEARALIEAWKPDLVYTSDDDAQEYVARHYLGGKLPFVFSGVNNHPRVYGFEGSSNVTGVLEHEHFAESVKLAKKIVPGAKRIALIFDDAKMWDPVRTRIGEAMKQLPEMRIVASDTVPSFADYQRKIREYQNSADIVGTIGIFNLKDADGKNVPYQEVQKWTVENSRLPDFAFWIDRVYYGTLCAVTVSEREQGRAAGRIARAILTQGRSPSSFAMAPTVKGMPVVSLARARKLGIRLDAEILLGAEIIQRFEWDQP